MTAKSQEIMPHTEGAIDPFVQMVERAASNPSVDVEKLERLLAMKERVETRQAEQSFNEAMAATQAEMRAIATDALNPSTKSRYATYAALDRVLRPIYTSRGFSLSFDTGDGAPDGHVRVLCYVAHGGHTRTYRVDMPADGKGAKGGDVMTKTHATGAAFTYAARYLLKMIFNVAVGEKDDDGNGATGQDYVTVDQVGQMRALIVEAGLDLPQTLGFFKIERLEDMAASRFDHAMRLLRKRAEKAG